MPAFFWFASGQTHLRSMYLRTTSEMGKQLNPYAVKTVLMRSGERLPMLCARATGAPLFQPALWSLTELRARNRSTAQNADTTPFASQETWRAAWDTGQC